MFPVRLGSWLLVLTRLRIPLHAGGSAWMLDSDLSVSEPLAYLSFFVLYFGLSEVVVLSFGLFLEHRGQ